MSQEASTTVHLRRARHSRDSMISWYTLFNRGSQAKKPKKDAKKEQSARPEVTRTHVQTLTTETYLLSTKVQSLVRAPLEKIPNETVEIQEAFNLRTGSIGITLMTIAEASQLDLEVRINRKWMRRLDTSAAWRRGSIHPKCEIVNADAE